MNLSGGMDSSSLLWASKNSDKNISALTTKFSNAPNEYNEEVKLAQKLCKSLDVEHDVIEITKKDFINNFIEAYQTVEEPNGNVAIPLYFLTAKYHKANNNTVVISGDGGDEMFGGYNRYILGPWLWRNISRVPGPIRRFSGYLAQTIPEYFWDSIGAKYNQIKTGSSGISNLGTKVHRLAERLRITKNLDDLHHNMKIFFLYCQF